MEKYRDIDTDAPDYEPLPFYSSDADLADWLASSTATGDGEVAEVFGASFGGHAEDEVETPPETPVAEAGETDFGSTAVSE
jgi:hypothetical protein